MKALDSLPLQVAAAVVAWMAFGYIAWAALAGCLRVTLNGGMV